MFDYNDRKINWVLLLPEKHAGNRPHGIQYQSNERSSDGGNRSHNVSLPIILKKTKVGQILQYSCISLLVVPILLYWFQVSVSLNVLLYFGAEMATFCIKHIENRKIFF